MNPDFQPGQARFKALQGLIIVALCAVVLSLAGCGSTKVYTADKTIVYGGSVYNVSNVKVFSYDVEGVFSGAESISLKNANKSRINDLLKQHGDFTVRQIINFDDEKMLYQSKEIDSWSDYSRMNSQFTSAAKKVQNFLADKKKTQLKLK